MVFSIIDVKMFVIRLFVFFVVLGILLFMFAALGDISRGSELERKLNELGEAMLSSEFTIARGVFDPFKRSPSVGGNMYGVDKTAIEPLRLCSNPATFEFKILEGGEYKSKWKFGYTPSMELTMRSTSREWNVWIKNDRGDIVPGLMRIRLWIPFFTHDPTTGPIKSGRTGSVEIIDVSCGISSAWALKREEVAEFYCTFYDGCSISASDKSVCFVGLDGTPGECRYIGADIPLKTTELAHPGTTKMRIIPLTGGPADCLGVDLQNKDAQHPFSIENNQTKEIAQIILCPIQQDLQGAFT